MKTERVLTTLIPTCLGVLLALALPVAARSLDPTGDAAAASTTLETATPTATVTATVTASPTYTPTATATETASPIPSRTPCPTFTPRPTDFRTDVQVHGNLVRGQTLPRGPVNATLSKPGGALVATGHTTSNETGYFVLPFENEQGQPIEIEADWRVVVTAPNGSLELQPPHLKLVVDPYAMRVRGEGPRNTKLIIQSSYYGGKQEVTTNAQGKFDEPWMSDRVAGGGDWADLYLPLEGGHRVYTRDRIVSLVVELGSNIVLVTAPPSSWVSASVEKSGPGRHLLATAATYANGWGEARLGMRHQATGRELPIEPGHRVIGTSKLVEENEHTIDRVPELDGRVAGGGGGVVGQTRPLAIVQARVYWAPDPLDPCTPTYAVRYAKADQYGRFAISFTSPVDGDLPRPLEEAERLVLVHRSVMGDEIRREISTEYGPVVASVYVPLVRKDPLWQP